MKGKVKWYDGKKRYGFIEGEDGKDYFVHHTAIAEGTRLRENDSVTFEPGDGERGPQARNVVLAGEEESQEESTEAEESEEETEEE